jgi:hypothetical protein
VAAVQSPFTAQEFFDQLAAYNTALWPVVLVIWVVSLVAALRLLSSGRGSGRWIGGLLAFHWAWSAIAYHAAYFTRINPAAWFFAAIFLLQASLLIWFAVFHDGLKFSAAAGPWITAGRVLIGYSLLYPAINAVQHATVLRIPTFGLPCPTTLLTVGILLVAASPPRILFVVPIVWSAIGGSAAWLMDVPADYALPVAGATLAVFAVGRPGARGPTAIRRSRIAQK